MAEIFKDPFIQKHSKVSAVRRVYDEKQHFINFGHNFFKPGELKPTYVWSQNKKIPNKQAIFTSLDDFHGYEFNVSLKGVAYCTPCFMIVSLQVGVLPWSHHALGDKVEAPEDAPATYTNYWGYEIELLKSISSKLNFR